MDKEQLKNKYKEIMRQIQIVRIASESSAKRCLSVKVSGGSRDTYSQSGDGKEIQKKPMDQTV